MRSKGFLTASSANHRGSGNKTEFPVTPIKDKLKREKDCPCNQVYSHPKWDWTAIEATEQHSGYKLKHPHCYLAVGKPDIGQGFFFFLSLCSFI